MKRRMAQTLEGLSNIEPNQRRHQFGTQKFARARPRSHISPAEYQSITLMDLEVGAARQKERIQ